MKKHFNKRKFDSRPRRESGGKKSFDPTKSTDSGFQRRDNRERRDDKRDSGQGERREGNQRRDEQGGGFKERRNDERRGKEHGTPKKTGSGFQREDKLEERGTRPWEKRKNKNNWGRDFKDKGEGKEKKPFEKIHPNERSGRRGNDDNRGRKEYSDKREGRESKPWEKRRDERGFNPRRDYNKKREDNLKKAFTRSEKNFSRTSGSSVAPSEGLIRLNKYLANAGICSRREADTFIAAGAVKVNGKIITQLGYKVSPGDKVQFGDNAVRKEKTVYILLNKPKGYITTTDDERDRATVLDLVQGVEERIYPVGRLDRNTSGLLLLTNDGELAKTLMHPKFQVAKVYHVTLGSTLKPDDLEKIRNGIELEDGFIKPDDIAYVEGAETRKEVGIEIHSGKNRIVRRIFESLGYTIEKLDRVLYAGLTKKNISRGKWRFLAENEVRMLKRIK